MAKTKVSKSTSSTASSWWNERGKILAMKSETNAAKPNKKVKTKKASKAETGQTYYCEEPMCIVI